MRWGRLIASGIAMVAFLLAMSPSDSRMKETGGPGIVPFELAGSQDRANEILAEWGTEGQDAARESLWIDFGFLLAYGTFLTFALAAVRDFARKRSWRHLASIGRVVIWFGALAAAAVIYLVAGLALPISRRPTRRHHPKGEAEAVTSLPPRLTISPPARSA